MLRVLSRLEVPVARCCRRPFTSTGKDAHVSVPSRCVDPFAVLIPVEEHRERQQKLVSLVAESIKTQVNRKVLLVVPAARKSFQADTKIPQLHLKQCSDFIYLTGLNTPEAADCVLAILSDSGSEWRSLLFVPPLTDQQLLWEGPGLKAHDFCQRIQGMQLSVENVKYLESFLHEECERRQVFATRDGLTIEDAKGRRRLRPESEADCMIRRSVSNLSPFIDQLRLIKSENEAKAMERTCSIGGRAMSETRSFSKQLTKLNGERHQIPLANEGQVAARFEYEVRLNGACKLAYPSVVAGSSRSTIIHYGSPDKFMKDDDWLLMDAGCEDIEGYNSDITRCWSLGGSGSSSQARLHAALYEALCEVQEHLITQLRTRNPATDPFTLDQLFQVMCLLLGKVLIEFCLIPKSSSTADSARAGYKFCPHHVSHYLGLDVHDTPSASRSLPLVSGMCFTVEPGLYFREVDDVKKEFKGIGIRVEDDLLIDKTGEVRVLTKESCSWI